MSRVKKLQRSCRVFFRSLSISLEAQGRTRQGSPGGLITEECYTQPQLGF